jgi:hypothetical protein
MFGLGIELTEESHSSHHPMIRLLECCEEERKDVIRRVSSCGQSSTSFRGPVHGTLVPPADQNLVLPLRYKPNNWHRVPEDFWCHLSEVSPGNKIYTFILTVNQFLSHFLWGRKSESLYIVLLGEIPRVGFFPAKK